MLSKLDCRMLCVPAAFWIIALSMTDRNGENPNVTVQATMISPASFDARFGDSVESSKYTSG
jgi:hypothetical protein